MAVQKKSILEETLAEIEDLKKNLEENAKYIMRGTLKEEINSLLSEADDDDDETQSDLATDLNPELDSDAGAIEPSDDSSDDMGDADPTELPDETMDLDGSSEEIPTDQEIEPAIDEPEMGPEMTDADDMDDVEDLRGKSYEEVLNVFKKMGPDDQVIVIRDDDKIHLKDGDNEYLIAPETAEPTVDVATDDELSTDVAIDEGGCSANANMDDQSDAEKTVFEIEIPDENQEDDLNLKLDENEEVIRGLNEQLINTRRKLAEAVAKSKSQNDQIVAMNSVIGDFKLNEREYKQTISTLKTQLNEVAVFTSNLTYTVKILTEHSTTSAEKKQILNRFDKAKDLNESRLTYESLVAEYSTKKTGTEETIQKIIEGNQVASGASKLNERAVYKNKELDRIFELCGIKK